MKNSWVFIAAATILFSTIEIALKAIAGDFSPMQLTMTRFLVGGIFLIPFALRAMKKRRLRFLAKDLRFLHFLGSLELQ